MSRVIFSAVLLISQVTLASIPSNSTRSNLENEIVELLDKPTSVRLTRIQEMPYSVYEKLLSMAQNDDLNMSTRWKSLTTAALLRKEESANDIAKFATAKEWFLRNASLVALKEFAPKKAKEIARKLIDDPALIVRSAAVEIISEKLQADDRELLWREQKLYSGKNKLESSWMRTQILEKLIANSTAVDAVKFQQLLSDSNEEIQKLALRGLEKTASENPALGISSLSRRVEIWKKADLSKSSTSVTR